MKTSSATAGESCESEKEAANEKCRYGVTTATDFSFRVEKKYNVDSSEEAATEAVLSELETSSKQKKTNHLFPLVFPFSSFAII